MKTAQERYDWIMNGLREGRTVHVVTYTRCTVISPKTFKGFEKAGHPLFKVSGNSVYMARGRNYDCIDGCVIKMGE